MLKIALAKLGKPFATRSDPLQIVSTRACLYGRGACANLTLKSAAPIKTNPTEWQPIPRHPRHSPAIPAIALTGLRPFCCVSNTHLEP